MLDYIQIVSLKKVSSEYVQYPGSFRSLKKWQQKNILRIAHNNHLRSRKWLKKERNAPHTDTERKVTSWSCRCRRVMIMAAAARVTMCAKQRAAILGRAATRLCVTFSAHGHCNSRHWMRCYTRTWCLCQIAQLAIPASARDLRQTFACPTRRRRRRRVAPGRLVGGQRT